MSRVERPVEQAHAFYLHGGDDLLDLGGVGAFGEVWDALDDGFWIHIGLELGISDDLVCPVLRLLGFDDEHPIPCLVVISTRCSRGRTGRLR